jgi:hypothetical protein
MLPCRQLFGPLGSLLVPLLIGSSLSAQPSAAKHPVPSNTVQQEALKLAKEVYGDEFTQAKAPDQKKALAERLLQKAAESKADPPAHFILLKLARDIATLGGEVEVALRAADEMAGTFQVDAYQMKGELVLKAVGSAELEGQRSTVAGAAMQLIDEAIVKDDFDLATRLAAVAVEAARKGKDASLSSQALARKADVEEIAAAYKQAKPAMATLEDQATDPQANLIVGQYLCLVKGDWIRGVSMLALGANEDLKKLARKDLEGPAAAAEQVKLGDGWWERAEASEGLAKKQFQLRAAYWYRQAVPGLTGLVRDKVERRVNEVGLDCPSRPEPSAAASVPNAAGTAQDAVMVGLAWLAQKQRKDGGWSLDTELGPENRVGATSLALLSFLGAGHTHQRGPWQVAVGKGLGYLSRQMRVGPNGGDLRGPADAEASMYVQGLASLAICEAYIRTKDRNLRNACQSAVNFIVFAQDPKGGGWRYQPRQTGDTSVTGWQFLALDSAAKAQLQVPRRALLGVERFLNSVQSASGVEYWYDTASQRKTGTAGEATTAIGLLCRAHLGWNQTTPALQEGVKRIAATGPRDNMYFNYFATRLMHRYGGEEWQQWRSELQAKLTAVQEKDGHWAMTGDPWYGNLGQTGLTSFCLMTLEVGRE